ncbi:damage-control phosphatase ARMT1 family protein [Nocardioides sp.]|uniref:damage-control phosphatase ARMT1 family protein n=1 Tax=Nocardioides sp. TaxID=35761 RepID=UPI0019C7BE46|nr:damage-control phosphatase ARMT1 family protein [Nocardioides sp.]MBC7275851.1 protein-glutamate O-methyltransferase family protein [Nocardioides sp.]
MKTGQNMTAEEIDSTEPDSFGNGVLTRRHPELIAKVRLSVPYPPAVQRSLDQLAETIRDVVPPFTEPSADRTAWEAWVAPYVGRPWLEVPFLWAESYFYRLLLQATGYFGDGPWAGVDPFKSQKDAELVSGELDRDLDQIAGIVTAPEEEGLHSALLASLWGNRSDLGFRLSKPQSADAAQVDDLIVDDANQVWSHLSEHDAGRVDLIADNAGRELVSDLVLIDRLLSTRRAARVVLHLKPQPYFVSDATVHDLLTILGHLSSHTGAVAAMTARLAAAIADGRIAIQAHAFWCSPLTFHDIPDDLAGGFKESGLVIVKGDLNYRRLVGDRCWPPASSFSDLVEHFPAPLVALRTLKSDLAVGIPDDRLALLEAHEPGWRTDGTHAVLQARLS